MNSNYAVRRPLAMPAPADPSDVDLKLFSIHGLTLFVVGFLCTVEVRLVGKLYVGEVLLGLIALAGMPILLGMQGKYGRLARAFLIAMAISWVGCVLSDVYRGTASNDYLRGWARWISLMTDFAALAWLGKKNIRYIVFLMLGWAVGNAVMPIVLHGAVFNLRYAWKFFFGVPLSMAAAYGLGRRSATVTAVALFALGVVSIVLDSRSLGAACILTAGVSLLAKVRRPRHGVVAIKNFKGKIVIAALTGTILLVASMFIIQAVGERYGYTERYERSNAKRWANVVVAAELLKSSPLIGYGSWARDPEVARIRDKILAKQFQARAYRTEAQGDLVLVHSAVLQSWIEGGLLGLVFFLLLGWQLAEKGIRLTAFESYHPLTPFIVFLLVFNSWGFFASPFSGIVRMSIAAVGTFACYLGAKWATAEQPAAPLHAAPRRRYGYAPLQAN